MSDIQKISHIKRETLNEEFYVSSLMEQAYKIGLMSEGDIQKVQMECLTLLAKKIEEYTGGASSSVRTEVAEELLQSIMFTVGFALKKSDMPDEAVDLLCNENIAILYAKGRKQIDTKLKVIKQLYRMLLSNMTPTHNYAYKSTVTNGIRNFFRLYNPDYSANQTHVTLDYPTANTIRGFVGIEFIQRYIESIYYENMFCHFFSEHDIHLLLSGYMKRYDELLINIFTLVLTNAIGCEMLHKDPLQLNITKEETECLSHSLSCMSRQELTVELRISCRLLFETMEIKSPALKAYAESTVSTIAGDVFYAVENNNLGKVFLEFPQQ
ncbi:MAG: DUF6179 domain-containing protein [Oscillospiraceae bacterium]